MKDEPRLWDHYINFKLLKAYIRRVKPTEELYGEVNNEVARIVISHQIQLLSALMDYYTRKVFPTEELFPSNSKDGDDDRALILKGIREDKAKYNTDLLNGFKPKPYLKPVNEEELLRMLKTIFLQAEGSLRDLSAPIKRPTFPKFRHIFKPRSHSNRPHERRESEPRQGRPSRSHERRDPAPKRNRSDSPCKTQESTHRQGRPSRSQGGLNFYPNRGRSHSNRPSHSHEGQDLDPKREGGRSDHPVERRDPAPKEDLPNPPLRVRSIDIKSGGQIRVTFGDEFCKNI
ncbi:hypothetical protein Trisim1_002205 [Trichoderma cf. simile WF8]